MPVPTITALPALPLRSDASSNAAWIALVEAFLAALPDWNDELNDFAPAIVAASFGYYRATSVSSNSIGTGAKSFTIDTGKAFLPGDWLLIADSAAPTANFLVGYVDTYDDTTGALAFVSVAANGSGTKTSWTVALTGKPNDANFSSSPSIVGTPFEDVYTITDGAAFAIDPANGSIQLVTLGANRTPTTTLDAGQSVTLMIDDGSAYSITWSTIGVTWKTNGGSAPTLNTSGFTVIVLWKVGSTVYGARVGDA